MQRYLLALVLGLALCAPAVADSTVRERATEEIMPGVRVRGGSVIIEVDGRRCGAPCPDGSECVEVCRDGSCDARSTADNPCRHCSWECVEE